MDDPQTTGNHSHRSAPVRRQLVLALVLALLAVLMLALTANAYVAQRTQDTLADFDRGTFTFTGLLDIPEEGIDSVQLMPLGLTGAMQESPQRLPEYLKEHATIAINNMIYVVGGRDRSGSVRSDVFRSRVIDDQGTLAPWKSLKALPDARSAAGIAAHHGTGNASTLYVVAGYNGQAQFTDTVFRVQIDRTTGAMSTNWTTDAHHLAQPTAYAPVVEHDGYLYVLGGTGVYTSFHQVHVAPIGSDGSLAGGFVETSPLPRPLFYGYAVVYEGVTTDTLYYIGGMYYVLQGDPPLAEPYASEEVYFADFLPGGGLTEWKRSEGALPRTLFGHGGVLVDGVELIVLGGIGNPKNPAETLSSAVKVALVDPDNSSFRLYNWCERVPEPCNLGAWLSGGLLPEVRAFHGAVVARDYIYVLGGWDEFQNTTNSIFFGTIHGKGALYAPEGEYRSEKIDLGQLATLRKLKWQASIIPTGQVTLTMKYRTSPDGDHWAPWSKPKLSKDGLNELEPSPPPTDIRFVQYEAGFSTVLTYASPRLDEVHILYEVGDPDLSVIKDTGSVITVERGSPLQYTIRYRNTGGWVAEGVVLTETLPAHTSYAGGPAWQQVGASNVYTHLVGDVGRGKSGSRTFKVQIDEDVPPDVYWITNRVEIDYPPMIDALGDVISDPNQDDNWHEFSNPLSFAAMAVTKEAVPPAGQPVTPGSLITYTLRYTNLGATRASQVVLTDKFDERGNYTIVTAPIPPTATEYAWKLGSLEPGQSGEKQVVVRVKDPLPTYWFVTNEASLSSAEGGVYHTPVVTHPLSFFAMAITKEAVPPAGEPVTPGSLITYTLRYTNLGGIRASQAVLTDTFDERGNYTIVTPPIPPTASEYVWKLGSLGPGQSGEKQVVVRIKDPLPTYWFVTNQASLYSPEGDVYHTPVVTHPLSFSAMAITKEAVPPAGEPVTPGSLITYTLHYTNLGATRASQVVLTDTFDEQGNYTIVTPPIPPAAPKYVWKLGSLEPGQSGEKQVVVRVKDPLPNYWSVTNQASLYSPEGGAYQTPIVTHLVMNMSDSKPAPMMDLVVTDVRWEPTGVVSGTWPKFTVIVRNTGTKAVKDPFWVALYIKPEGSSPPLWPADHDRGYCLRGCRVTRPAYVEYVDALATGKARSLLFENLQEDRSLDFPRTGVYDIYVQADVAFAGDNPYWGRLAEDREDNNLWHGMLTIEDAEPTEPPRAYMPVILRGSP